MSDSNLEFQHRLAQPHVFRPSLIPAMAPVSAVIVFVLVVVWVTADPSDLGWVRVVSVVFVGVFALVALLVRLITLTVSLDGLTYDTLVYRVHARWDDLAGITSVVMGARTAESIIVRNPVIEGGFWYQSLPFLRWIAVLSGRMPMSVDSSRHQNLIPISFFDNNWRASEIGTLVAHFAPQVLNKQPAEQVADW
jgi:hypothetical protein